MKQSDNCIDKNAVRNEFGEKIGRLTKSNAFLDFCEEVYGYRAYMFNMMDKEQIDYVLNAIPVTPDDTILDLGCGTGSMLELFIAKYGCPGIGIDMLDRGAVKCDDGMSYLCGDIDEIADYRLKPSITLSIDSLYFSSDLDKLVRELTRIKKNKLYFFYSQYLFDEAGDRSMLQGSHTKLAQALGKAEAPFRMIDFSENEYHLYFNMEKALKKHERAFAAEKNSDLYAQKLREVNMGLELFAKGLASRYLYISETA